MAQQLNLLRVLVRPEVGHQEFRHGRALGPVVRQGSGVIVGDLPVFDSRQFTPGDVRPLEACHVANGRNAIGGEQVFIDDDPVIDRES